MTTTHGVDQVTLPTEQAQRNGWVRFAACGTADPAMFFSPNKDDIAAALTICAQCPVRDTYCAKTPMATDRYAYGVWGGQWHPEHRDAVDRPGVCGTEEGPRAHKRENELLCVSCRAVVDAEDAERREAHPRHRKCGLDGCDKQAPGKARYCSPECRHVATVGSRAGYRLHKALDEPICDACAAGTNHPGSRTTAAACLVTAA